MAKNALIQILFFLGHDLTIHHDIMVLFLKTRDRNPSFYSPLSCHTFFPFLLQLSRTLTANKQLFCLLLPLFVTQFSSTPPPIALFSLLLGGPTLHRSSIVELLLIAIPFHWRETFLLVYICWFIYEMYFLIFISCEETHSFKQWFYFFCRHTDLSFSPGEVRLVDPKSIPTYKQPTLATFKCLNPPSCTWNLKYDCPMCQYAIGVNTAENLLVLHALWLCSSWAWCYPVNALYLKC